MTLTKRDFDEMKIIFPTKNEMLNKFDAIDDKFDAIDDKFDELEEKGGRRHNSVMDTLDKILKMFKKFDEEQVVLSHRVSNHEDRISKLEIRTSN